MSRDTPTNTPSSSQSITASSSSSSVTPPSPSSFKSIVHDIAAGSFAGCCSVIVGQPFDTVKVRLQTSPHLYTSAFHCLRTTTQQGALFRGMVAPLVGSIPLNALAFGSNGWANRQLDHMLPDPEQHMQQRLFLSGLWAGTTQSIVACPVDVIKCNMQIAMQAATQTATTTATGTATSTTSNSIATSTSSTTKIRRAAYTPETVYTTTKHTSHSSHTHTNHHPQSMFAASSSSCASPPARTFSTTSTATSIPATSSRPSTLSFIRSTISQHGLRGLYRGWYLTAARDSLSYAVYFTSYEYVKNVLAPNQNSDMYTTHTDDDSHKHVSMSVMLLSGGIAGVTAWSVVYPLDVIKSIVQTSTTHGSTSSLIRTRLSRDGMSLFTRGLAPTLIRAFPVNGVLLLVFESSLRWLNGR